MKKKVFHIDIPKPCSENWNEMTQTERGAFCAHCQKEVIDFTQKTPSEIAQYFANKKGKSCGRFYNKQLNEVYTYYEPQKQNNLKYAAGLALGLLVAENSFAQENTKPKVEIVDSKIENKQSTNIESDSLVIRGVIEDEKTKESLIGVNVNEEDYSNNFAVTDIDGKFEIKVSKIPTKLLISYIGYEKDSVSINRHNMNTNIKLKMAGEWMGEIVVVQRKLRDDVYSGSYNPVIHKKRKKK